MPTVQCDCCGVQGSCCNESDYSCSITLEQDCEFTWVENGNCNDNCGTFGSCCDEETYYCAQTREQDCEFTWVENGNCNTCGPLGECCSSEDCSLTTESQCSGNWTLGGDCSGGIGQCQDLGYCCFSDTGNCSITTLDNCSGSSWSRESDCSNCHPVGACCNYEQESCSYTIESDCEDVWTLGGDCNTCGAMGACCNQYWGYCSQSVQRNCYGGNRQWTEGADCVDVCFPIGTCCDTTDYTCFSNVTQANCDGVWTENGDCRRCREDGLGACCEGGYGCSITSVEDCAGTWIENGVCGDSCSTEICCACDAHAQCACGCSYITSEDDYYNCSNFGGVIQSVWPDGTCRCC